MSRFSLSDYTHATERTRRRHPGGPNTRTTCPRVVGQVREPCIPYDPADQEHLIRLDDEKQLVTDTAELKMTEEALAEDTAAFEDTMQDCLAIQTKAADYDVHINKSLSEELEALAKAKAVISEKTGDAEYRDNRSVLSSR